MKREPKREILVNRHTLALNKKRGERKPVISVQRSGRRVQYAHRVDILDTEGNAVASVIYNPDRPRKCGATVWIEARAGVKLYGEGESVACEPEEFDGATAPSLPFTSPGGEAEERAA